MGSKISPQSGAVAAAETLLTGAFDGSGSEDDNRAFLGDALLAIRNLVGGGASSIWRQGPGAADDYVLEIAIERDDQASTPCADAGAPQVARWIELGRTPRHDPPSQVGIAPNAEFQQEEKAYLAGLGVRSFLNVNLSLADVHLGVLIVRLRHDRPVVDRNRELIERVAQRIALVLYRSRIALELGEQAIVRERQAEAARVRAEKLALANALLRETSDRFGTPEDLDAFLGRILLTVHDVVGGHSVTMWLTDVQSPLHLILSHIVENGRITPAAKSSHTRRAIGTTPTARSLSNPQLHGPRARPIQFDLTTDGDLLHPDETAQLLALGVRQLVSVPLSLGDRLLGYLTIRLTDDRKVLEEDLDLVHALAGQAAVALHLARLAEDVKQAAIARERETTERNRADALHRANAVIQTMLKRLSERQNLRAFLGEALTLCACELGAVDAQVWRRIGPGEHGLIITAEGGKIRMSDEESYLTRLVGPFPGLEEELAQGKIAFRTLAELGYQAVSGGKPVISMAVVPMFFSDRWLGAIAFRHTSDNPGYSPEKEQLAFALGAQIALALEMQRLALEAGEAARSEERNRLAREIHDTLAQGFAAIRMQLELARGHEGMPADVARALDAASEIAAENLIEARRSLAVLTSKRPSLVTALSAAIEGVRRLGQTPVVAEFGGAPEPPPEVAHELLRICQEAMLNAIRHAEAGSVRVTLSSASERGVRLSVADDGKGFDPEQVTAGFGLSGLRERASAINAELTIISEPGAGAEVIATWAPD